MDGSSPLRPQGDTFVIGASPAAPAAATQATISPNAGEVDYLMFNPGAFDAFVGYGMTSTAAVGNAVTPVIGASSKTVQVPHGLMKTYTLSGQLYFAAVSPLGSTTINITPGYGV